MDTSTPNDFPPKLGDTLMAKWGTRFITENRQLSDPYTAYGYILQKVLLHCMDRAKSSLSIEEIRTYEEIADMIRREMPK